MKGHYNIIATIRGLTQSTSGIPMRIHWDTSAEPGEVSATVTPADTKYISLPLKAWYRIIDQTHATAYHVKSTQKLQNGAILATLKNTPIFALERKKIQELHHAH